MSLTETAYFKSNLDVFETKTGLCPDSEKVLSVAVAPELDIVSLETALDSSDAVMLCGAGSGWEIIRIFNRMKSGYFSRKRPLYIVLETPEQAFPLLRLEEAHEVLAAPEVFFFFKSQDDDCSIISFFAPNPSLPLPRGVVSLAARPDFHAHVSNLVQTVHNRRNNMIALLKRELASRYVDYSHESLAERILQKDNKGAAGLRILAFSSRFTSYVQFCLEDCRDAFEAMGHQMRVWTESADIERLSGLVVLQEIKDYNPDLIFCIDHTRYEYPGLYPEKLPFLTWVQDELPEIYNAEVAAAIGDYDYIFSSGYRDSLVRFGYPMSQVFEFMECTNTKRFAPVDVCDVDHKRYAAELSFVSHASSTPEEELRTLKQELFRARLGPRVMEIVNRFFVSVENRARMGEAMCGKKPYEIILSKIEADLSHPLEPRLRTVILDRFFGKIGNRFFRQLPLEWAAEAGIDLKLWGHGWENHPRLGNFACGVAHNNTELNKVFNASKVNLQLSHHDDIVHPRLLDCMSAGAPVLIRTDLAYTWRHWFLYNCFWFESAFDFKERMSWLLDSRNSKRLASLTAKIRAGVDEHYGFGHGMRCMLDMVAFRILAGTHDLFDRKKIREPGFVAQRIDAAVALLDRCWVRDYVRNAFYIFLRYNRADNSVLKRLSRAEGGAAVVGPDDAYAKMMTEVAALFDNGEYARSRDLAFDMLRHAPASFAPTLYLLLYRIATATGDSVGTEKYLRRIRNFHAFLDRDALCLAGLGRRQVAWLLDDLAYHSLSRQTAKAALSSLHMLPGQKADIEAVVIDGMRENGMPLCAGLLDRLRNVLDFERRLVLLLGFLENTVEKSYVLLDVSTETREELRGCRRCLSVEERIETMFDTQEKVGRVFENVNTETLALCVLLEQIASLCSRLSCREREKIFLDFDFEKATRLLSAMRNVRGVFALPDFAAFCSRLLNWTAADRVLKTAGDSLGLVHSPSSRYAYAVNAYCLWNFRPVVETECGDMPPELLDSFLEVAYWSALFMHRRSLARRFIGSFSIRGTTMMLYNAIADCSSGEEIQTQTEKNVSELGISDFLPPKLYHLRCALDCSLVQKAEEIKERLGFDYPVPEDKIEECLEKVIGYKPGDHVQPTEYILRQILAGEKNWKRIFSEWNNKGR